ncbi:MAG: dTDP-4-dehydrorhamnose reductase [Thiomargarita sp.]|nr:dTDP-4-dehydrorhamnose reductase [Thiomargarita sp.]
MHNRILIIGTSGQVGWELCQCMPPLGEMIGADRQQLKLANYAIDLANPDSIRSVIRQIKPNIIINAAAYTAVDKAETEAELAHKINGVAPGILAEVCLELDALLVHYSTDYVFNGQQNRAYVEEDAVNPIGVYGRTKLAGEQAVSAVGGKYLILRTAWVYGLHGKNFLLTMQHLATERKELKVVSDQIGSPTWSRMIAQATSHIIAKLDSPFYQANIEELAGLYHITCGGETSWYQFAKNIVALSDKQPTVLPIKTVDYPTPAKRPAYSVLSNKKLVNTFGINLPHWEQALNLCLS